MLHVAFRQQPHVIQQLARRNGARAFLLHARRAGTADPQFQIRSGQSHAVAGGLQEHVGQDRNGGLLFHHALRQTQFSYQIGLADSEFHGPQLLFSVGCIR